MRYLNFIRIFIIAFLLIISVIIFGASAIAAILVVGVIF